MQKEAATVRGILFPRSFTAIVFISFGLLVTGVLLWVPTHAWRIVVPLAGLHW